MLRIAVVAASLLLSACQSPVIVDYADSLKNTTPVDNLVGTHWRIEVLYDKGVIEHAKMDIQFGENDISGFSGCNIYKGTYQITDHILRVSTLATTRKLCSQTIRNYEQLFLHQLENKPSVSFSASGDLLLINENQQITRLIKE